MDGTEKAFTESEKKRLAMHVEDHPREYGTFEGVIPSGYGAGIVVLWDHGVWQPMVDDVDAAIERGNLPFVLLAEKVEGAWTLIRTGRAGPKAWLLIKQNDKIASTDELTEHSPGSVASDGGFAEVLAKEQVDPLANGSIDEGWRNRRLAPRY